MDVCNAGRLGHLIAFNFSLKKFKIGTSQLYDETTDFTRISTLFHASLFGDSSGYIICNATLLKCNYLSLYSR